MVGRLTLDQEVGVRVPAPQPHEAAGNSGFLFTTVATGGGALELPREELPDRRAIVPIGLRRCPRRPGRDGASRDRYDESERSGTRASPGHGPSSSTAANRTPRRRCPRIQHTQKDPRPGRHRFGSAARPCAANHVPRTRLSVAHIQIHGWADHREGAGRQPGPHRCRTAREHMQRPHLDLAVFDRHTSRPVTRTDHQRHPDVAIPAIERDHTERQPPHMLRSRRPCDPARCPARIRAEPRPQHICLTAKREHRRTWPAKTASFVPVPNRACTIRRRARNGRPTKSRLLIESCRRRRNGRNHLRLLTTASTRRRDRKRHGNEEHGNHACHLASMRLHPRVAKP
jgi:hypothetical protein